MEQRQGTDINVILKEIAFLRTKADQLEMNLVELLVKENQTLQSQHKMAMDKIQELEKKNSKKQ